MSDTYKMVKIKSADLGEVFVPLDAISRIVQDPDTIDASRIEAVNNKIKDTYRVFYSAQTVAEKLTGLGRSIFDLT